MTATRACLVNLDRDEATVIIPSDTTYGHNGNVYCDCDFPSTASPFKSDSEPSQCLGFGAEVHSKSIPLKLYWIAVEGLNLQCRRQESKLRQLRRLFPPVNDLFLEVNGTGGSKRERIAHRRRVFQRLRDIFVAHLQQVKSQVDVNASHHGYDVVVVTATLPPAWTPRTQRNYLKLLREVWTDIPASDFHWLEESEAIGHLLLRSNNIDVKEKRQLTTYLQADFGGHTLSTYTFELVRQRDGANTAFFSTSASTCAYGGSELHTLLVKEHIEKQIKCDLDLTDDETRYLLEDCLDYYRRRLRAKMTSKSFVVRGCKSRDDDKLMTFDISSETSESFYDMCFATPLRSLFKKINEHASTHAAVVLTGGSFLNNTILKEVKRKIEEAGMTCITTDKFRLTGNRSASACVGAAFALKNTVTVREFLERAVFAVRDVGSTSSYTARAILDRGVSLEETFDLGEDAEIVCHPWQARWDRINELGRRQGKAIKTVPCQKTYGFHTLRRYKCKGKCKVALLYEPENEQHGDQLVMTISTQNSLSSVSSSRRGRTVTRTIPIFYDPGPCVVFVDQDNYNAYPEADKSDLNRRRRNAASNAPTTGQVELDAAEGEGDGDDHQVPGVDDDAAAQTDVSMLRYISEAALKHSYWPPENPVDETEVDDETEPVDETEVDDIETGPDGEDAPDEGDMPEYEPELGGGSEMASGDNMALEDEPGQGHHDHDHEHNTDPASEGPLTGHYNSRTNLPGGRNTGMSIDCVLNPPSDADQVGEHTRRPTPSRHQQRHRRLEHGDGGSDGVKTHRADTICCARTPPTIGHSKSPRTSSSKRKAANAYGTASPSAKRRAALPGRQ
ncbi:hypothetical protein JDV02_003576 [Purpureocillium takamizusanense]|nr:uncharacterized protein JDV02_003576 [Purpureocillium takamizusanense]UNI17207.1 hypothetical protein JDV02_003576 [Purpureocillium takamizusanense]